MAAYVTPARVIAANDHTAHMLLTAWQMRRTVPVATAAILADTGLSELTPGQRLLCHADFYATTATGVQPERWTVGSPLPDEWIGEDILTRRFPSCCLVIAINEGADVAHVAPVTFPLNRTVPVALSQIREQAGLADVRPGQWFDAVVSGYAETAPDVRPDQWELSPELPDRWMEADCG